MSLYTKYLLHLKIINIYNRRCNKIKQTYIKGLSRGTKTNFFSLSTHVRQRHCETKLKVFSPSPDLNCFVRGLWSGG